MMTYKEDFLQALNGDDNWDDVKNGPDTTQWI